MAWSIVNVVLADKKAIYGGDDDSQKLVTSRADAFRPAALH